MKYKILAIAPYDALANTMIHLASSRDDIELTMHVGNLERGVEIVKEYEGEDFDAIISRGGTAKEISRHTTIPVVSIPLSVYDVLRAIRLAENYNKDFAIVGFSNITETAHTLCDLLQYRIKIVTITDEPEVRGVLAELEREGCSMVLCDLITHEVAKTMNLNAILITSGAESILSTFEQAVNICKSYHHIGEENNFLRSILQDLDASTIVMSEHGDIFLSTWNDDNDTEIYELLKSGISGVISQGGGKFFKTVGNTLYSVIARVSSYKNKKYVIFYVTKVKIPLMSGKHGIHFSNRKEVEKEYFESFYSISGTLGNLKVQLEEIAENSLPVIITSEEGTGKKQVANYIYMKSDKCGNPFVEIDCNFLNDRNWEYIINNYNSPFNDNDNTVYIANIEKLSSERHKKLLSFILDTRLYMRNRLILSTGGSADPEIATCIKDYMRLLNCMNVNIIPLRHRADEIPMLAGMYLGHLNVILGKQLLGFDPKAIRILQEYDWPTNYNQFKRVIMEAATLTNLSYVSADIVADLISAEKAAGVYSLFTSKEKGLKEIPKLTLEEIILGVVKKALDDNKGNQSKTAKQLGISRTTLWRYLSKAE